MKAALRRVSFLFLILTFFGIEKLDANGCTGSWFTVAYSPWCDCYQICGNFISDCDDIVSLNWNFGDGTTATGGTPCHHYAAPGTYTITMTVTAHCHNFWPFSTGTTTCPITQQVVVTTINSALAAHFTADTACLGVGTHFTNTSVVPPNSSNNYHWYFGDGTSSTSANPTHTFDSCGVYDVMLIVTNSMPCCAMTGDDTIIQRVYVDCAPFDQSNVSGSTDPYIQESDATVTTIAGSCAGSNTQLQLTVNGPITNWQFVFPDGSTSTSATPTYVYTACPPAVSYTYVHLYTNHGCHGILDSVTGIFCPTNLALSSTTTLCTNQCSGTATVNMSGGGTPPYSFSWSDPAHQATATAINLCTGNYNVTVTDGNGCTALPSQPVNVPNFPFPFTGTPTVQGNARCYGWAGGSAVLNYTGGTPPYSTYWDNGATTLSVTGLTGGSHTVTGTDAHGCIFTATINISQPPPVTATASTIDASCGFCDGSATVNPSGGNGVFVYRWLTSPIQTTQTASGLCAGVYLVEVEDGTVSGCNDTISVSIGENGAQALTATATKSLCLNSCNGSATAVPTGGCLNPPCTYDWLDASGVSLGVSTATASNLCPGTYTVHLTNGSGCSSFATATVGIQDQIIPTATPSPNTCTAPCSGSIVVSTSGGVPTYTYQWYNAGNLIAGQSAATINNLCPGNYSVQVTDQQGCKGTAAATVLTNQLVSSATASAVKCNGDCNGIITAVTSGGKTPYFYQLKDASGNIISSGGSSIIANLCAGSYNLIVTDAAGCSITTPLTISQPAVLNPVPSTVQPLCFGNCNGSVSVAVNGGIGPYTYEWKFANGNALPGGTLPTVNNLCAGNYVIKISDVNNCFTPYIPVTLSQPAVLDDSMQVIDPYCTQGQGSINLTVFGGTGPYTYSWNSGTYTTQDISGLSQGTYQVVITDAHGCTTSDNTTFVSLPPLTETITATTHNGYHIKCNGGSDGEVVIRVNGGLPPYSYQWNDSASSTVDSIYGLPAGTYSVTVTDANGCMRVDSVKLDHIPPPFSLTTTHQDVTCFGGNNGSAGVTPVGGVSPYFYYWAQYPSIINQPLTGVGAGQYIVYVFDSVNCLRSDTVVVSEPPPFVPAISPATVIFCSGGSVTLTSSGGTGYLWSNTATTSSITVSPTTTTTYSVTASNAAGCTGTDSRIVTVNPSPTVTIPPPASLTCIAATVTLTASASPAGVNYVWSGGGTASTKTVSAPGPYSVTVTDPANGCTASASATVVQNITIPNVSIAPPAVLTCAVTTVTLTASSANPALTYDWGGGVTTATKSVSSPGLYTVTATDPSNGCTVLAFTTVTQSVTIPNVSIAPPVALTCALTAVTLVASSSTPGVNYNWGGGITANTNAVNAPGSYAVTVTDPSNSCTASASMPVTQNIIIPNVSIAPPAALTCMVSTVTITASSSTSGATYNWGGGVTTAARTISAPGPYSVTVTDPANGCTASASATVVQNLALPNVSIAPPAILNCIVLSVNLTASSSTSGATYNWGGGITTAARSVNSPGTYSVTVTDPANGCTASASASVTQNINIPNVTIAPPAALTCTVFSVTLTASSTTPGATYKWAGGPLIATKIVNATGTYVVTVTDPVSKCTASTSATVIQNIVPPNVSIAPPAVITCSAPNVTLVASSSTTGVTYDWGGGITTATKTVSSPGSFSVTVTDPANGCSASSSATVVQSIAIPNVSIAAPATLTCAVTTVTLTASSLTAGVNYDWGGGLTSTTKTVSAPGAYSVTVTDPSNGCTASTLTTVVQNITTPNVSIAPPAVLTCTLTTVTLTASSLTAGVNYDWGGGITTNTKTVSAPGPYSVTVTDPSNGCTATASATVIQNIIIPNLSIAAPAVLTCVAANVTLTASSATSGVTYDWGGGLTTTTKTVSAPGLYSVTVTDPSNGCTAAASATVSQNIIIPNVSIAPPAALTCAVTTVTLTASSLTAGVLYDWGGGVTGTSRTVSAPGSYSVTITDPSNGCSATTSAAVIQNIIIPNVTIAPPVALTCALTSVTLTASSSTTGVTFDWGSGLTTATKTVSAPGPYSVTATDPSNGCTASASTTVSQSISIPNVSIAPPAVLTCSATSVTLTASSSTSGVTFDWGGGATSAAKTVSAPGAYSVTVTDPSNGCTATTSTTVTQNIVIPNVSIAPPAALTCAVTTVTLTASSLTAGVSYDWGGGVTSSAKTVPAAGAYSVTVTDPSNGCTAATSATVTQNIVIPNVSIAPPAALTCAVTTVTLTASSLTAGVLYDWGGGVTGASKTVSAPGSYTVTVTDPSNGCTATTSATVTQNIIIPAVSIAAPAVLTCVVSTITLTASSPTAGVNFDWGGGATTASRAVSTIGTYSVTVTDPSNGCSASVSTIVTQNGALPDVSIANPAVLTCSVSSVTLNASSLTAGVTYDWGGGVTGTNKTVSAPGPYSVTVTDPSNGCMASASVTVIQNVIIPNITIAPPAQLTCSVATVTLAASSSTTGATYDWGGGVTTASRTVSASGSYSVTATDPANGCSATASTTVIQNITIPNVSIAAPATLTCATATVTLTASSLTAGVSYDWGGGVTTSVKTVAAPGPYSVTVTDPSNGCTASTTTTVIQNTAIPNVSIATPSALTCSAGSVTLTASSLTAGVSYDWGGGVTTSTKVVSAPGPYSVTVTDPANGCSASASVTVAQNITVPDVSIAPPVALSCTLTTITLTAASLTSGVTYDWGGGITTVSKTVSVPGPYSVTVTDPSNGCTATASVVVIQNISVPNVGIAASGTLTCSVSSVTLTASSLTAGVTYDWGSGITGSSRTVSLPGPYSITVTDPSNGCTASAATTVVQSITVPNVSITAPATLTCAVSSVTITASSLTAGVSYDWGGGITGPSRTVTNPGPYSITVTDPSNGCTASASTTVIQNTTIPNVSIATPAALTCTVLSVTLTASSLTAGVTYDWGGGITGSSRTVSTPGPYSITVTDPSSGCTASAATSVIQNVTIPNVSIAVPGVLTCAVSSVTLTASSLTAGVTYDWGGGVTSSTKTVSAPGPYSITVTDPSNGCTASVSTAVTQNIAIPNVTIAAPAILTCSISSVTLTASSLTAGVTYDWGGGVTTSVKIVSTQGPYSITVTDPLNGCTASTSTTVTQNMTIPNISIAPPAMITCVVTSVTLTASSSTSGVTYDWGGGITTNSNTVNTSGTYSVTVTDPGNNCSASASTTVTQSGAIPVVSIAPPAVLTCAVTIITLTASSPNPGVTYDWGGGVSTATKAVSTPGPYSVTITDPSNGCMSSAATTVTQNIIPPNVSIATPAGLTCSVNAVTLTASSTTTGAAYDWGGGVTTATNVVSSPGSYSVTVTDPSNGCTASASSAVTENIAIPNVSIVPPAVISCAVTSVTLTASSTTTGATYDWGGGVTTATKTISAAGSYSVTVTDPSNGCTSSSSTTVTQNISVPNVSIALPAMITCTVTSVTLSASSSTSGVTYDWGGGITTNTNTVNTSGTYSVTVTDPSNGCSASASTTVTQSGAIPIVSIAPPAVLTCAVTSITLTASSPNPGVTYDWGGGITTATRAVTTPGPYSVTITDPSNGCMGSASTTVTQNIIIPNVTIAPPAELTCSITTITLSASSTTIGVTYDWGGGVTTSTKTISAAGPYSVTVTDPSNGCTALSSTTVTQNIAVPNVSIAPPAMITCTITSVTLSASSTTSGVIYDWGGGITTNTNTVNTSGTYSVTVTDPGNGCSASASTTVTQSGAIPVVNIAPPAVLTCAVTTITLTASSPNPGVTYDWGGGVTTATKTVTVPGPYSVTITDPSNGCMGSASTTVTQNIIIPNVTIAPPAELTCSVGTVTLTASSTTTGATFDWGGGITTATQTVSAIGPYSVTVTDPSNGCTALSSTTVTQNITVPNVSIAPPAMITCTITSVTLSASSTTSGVTYDWGGGITTNTNTVNTSGTYSMTVTDPTNGCSASASATVTQSGAIPVVSIAPPAVLTCAVTTITLTASSPNPGVTYDWGGGITTATRAVTSPGPYSVTITDPSNGCMGSASTTVTQNIIIPNVTIAPPAELTCSVSAITLSASSTTIGVTYDWGGGVTTSTKTISAAGPYSVTVTDPSNGCTASGSTTVTQNINIPNVSIAPPSMITCTVTSVTLSASSSTSGVIYDWGGGITTNTNTVNASGTYSVTVTDPANGCSASASTIVTQSGAIPVVSIAPPAVLTCAVTTITLTASSPNPGVTYDWGGGITTATKAVTAPGPYSVTITDPSNGCMGSASTTVTQNVIIPNVTIAPPAELTCSVSTVTLTASSTTTGATFDWGGGITTATQTVSAIGPYSVTVTDPSNGCTALSSTTVTQNIAVPNVSIAPPAMITCTVTSVTLTASSTTSGVIYDWGGGITTNTNTVNTSGTYSVTVTDPGNGCSASASTTVTQSGAIPVVNIAPPAVLTCAVTTITLTASSPNPGVTYDWGGGVTTATKTVTVPGPYSVTITDPSNGCMGSASTTVTQNIIIPNVTIAPPAELTCSVSTVTLTASSTTTGATFDWGGGITTATQTVSAIGPSSVTVTDPSNGCTALSSTTVTQNIAVPNVSIAPPAMITCTITSVTLSASSTTSGVTYDWGGGITTNTNTVNTSGTFSLTITDPANGCSASASTTVTQSGAIPVVSIAPPAVLTCVVSTVTLTASSPNPGVTYDWGGGVTTATKAVSVPGPYSVTITDISNGCLASASTTITQNIIIPNVTIAPPAELTCLVSTVTLTASSTTAGATFDWGGGITTATQSVSTSGTYSVTVTDASNGCTALTSTSVTQNITVPNVSIAPPAMITCTITSVTLSASSTTSGVTYDWGGGITTNTNTVNTSGTYSVTVTDPANGCSASASTTVTQSGAIPVVSIASPAVLTCAVTTITLTASSPNPGVTYDWGGGITTATKAVTTPGPYSVTITDPSNSCMGSASTTVTQNIIIPNVTIAPPAELTCSVSTVTLTASSTTTGATFDWGGGITTATQTVSAIGPYSVTVADPSNGCTALSSTTVTQNIAVPNVSIAPPAMITCTVTSVTLTASSTTSGVIYDWGGGITTNTNTVNTSGTYSVTVTDPANGCSASASTTVTQSGAIPVVSIASPAVLTCAVTTITLTASSPNPGVTYDWGGGITTATKAVTSPGPNSVTITDVSNGCLASASTTVTQNIIIPNVTIAPPAELTCSVSTVTLTASSTTAGATFDWGAGITTATQTVSSPGPYSVTVSDPSNGCTASTSTTVTQNIIVPNVSIAPPAMITCTVTSVMITATSSTSGVTYDWGGGITTNTNTVNTSGTFSLTITDPANGCSASASTTVTQSGAIPVVSIAPPAVLTCVVSTVTLTASSPNPGVTYDWGGGVTTATKAVSVPGPYSVTITDISNGCLASASTTITQNIIIPNVTIAPPAELTCLVSTVTLTASSTTAGATFDWSGGITTATQSVSTSGTYSVTVTDASNGCTALTSTSVTQNITVPNVIIAPPADLTCSVTSVILIASSTTSGAIYDWGGGITTARDTVFAAGNYSVTVTDPLSGCSASASETVNSTSGLTILVASSNVLCNGSSTGSINITPGGGMLPYTFAWNDGPVSEDRIGIPAGIYSVAVSDNNACSAMATVTIREPLAFSVTATHTNVPCNGGNIGSIVISPSGGTAPYHYTWNDADTSQNRSFVAAGTYSVTVSDQNACTFSLSMLITQPSALSVIETHNNVLCNGENNGSIDLSVAGGASPYTYLWSDGSTLQNRINISANVYTVTITDNNTCSTTLSVAIAEPPALAVTETHVDGACGGGTGSIDVSVTGGTVPYSYSWNDGPVTQDRINIPIGNYAVIVSDSNSCSASISVAIASNSGLVITETHNDVSCFGANDASIHIRVSGGALPYTFAWNNSATTQDLLNIATGNYSISVNDNNSCSAVLSGIIIAEPTAIALSEIHANVACNGDQDGTITLAVSGGTQPYIYIWNDGITSQNRNNLGAGNYSVTVNDSHACPVSIPVIITEPPVMVMGTSFINPTCESNPDDGSITLNVTGGTLPYQYIWSNGSTAGNLIHIGPGTYLVTVSDAHNCDASASFMLSYLYDFTIDASPSVTINYGESTTLSYTIIGNTGVYSNVWTPFSTLSCSDCVSPEASPTATTVYHILVTNDAGCRANDEVTVYVLPDHTIFVPNVFTPNGDGNNDFFEVYGKLKSLAFLEIQVFNRWGEKVFESNDHHFKWDGTYKGVMQNPAVFVWQLKLGFLDGIQEEIRKGSVTLVR